VDAAAYHAGMSDGERTRVQDRFAAGDLPVVCATNAFGMGIDRPDVEIVVHMDVPASLEAYYQEIGRAGRDGRAAAAVLFWNYADVKTREYLIDLDDDEPWARARRAAVPIDPAEVARRKELEHAKLKRMVAYATTSRCLRATLLRYFSDPAAHEPCGACGTCDRITTLDEAARTLVRKVLSGIARGGERFGRRRITAMLAGDVDDLPDPLRRLSTTGLLRDVGAARVERWIEAACAAGLVAQSTDKYRILRLTMLGRDVMAGRVERVEMAVPEEPAAPGRRTAGRRRKGGARRPSA
jgi:ATP-dependent DNA helicase RecQ